MSQIVLDQKVPDFTLPASGDRQISLRELRGQRVVLYFYPKDSTPGCTQEGIDFRDHHAAFTKLNTVILGVSRDSVKKHDNFVAKHAFNFALLADTEETLCRMFDVIKPKKMYGREVIGVERSTFLIDAEGILRREWRKVKVKGHVAEVLAAVAELD
jgi:peroxiredoxin Q/BCP